MLTIGLDPGIGTTGYGFIQQLPSGDLQLVDYGVILTPTNLPMEQRLLVLYEQLKELLLLHHPNFAGMEKLFFAKNITTAITVGQARGIMLLTLAQAGIPVFEFSPPEIKQAVTGYGGAEKHQMQLMVQSILGLSDLPRPDDAADALAVAICQIHRARYDQLMRE